MDLRQQFQKIFSSKQDRFAAVPGVLGDGTSLVQVPDKNNFVYVRIDGQVIQVYNIRVSPVPDLEVWVGYEPSAPDVPQVLMAKTGYAYGPEQAQANSVTRHGGTHSWSGGDPVAIWQQQFMPGKVAAYVNQKVVVYPILIRASALGTFVLVQAETPVDLGIYAPATVGKALYVLASINTAGVLVWTPGSAVDITALAYTDIPALPAGTQNVLAAVRLYFGQEAIIEAVGGSDIIDLRAPVDNQTPGGNTTDVTLGAGSDPALSIVGQVLTLADVLTPTEHTAIGNSSPHHAPVTLATNHGLSLTGQQLALGTPSTLTGATTNAVTTTTHTHALTGFEPAQTKGNLTTSAPLSFDSVRQVIGGPAALTFDTATSALTKYLKLTGGSIQPTSDSNELILKQYSGQTATMLEFQNSSGAVLGAMTALGHFGVGTTPDQNTNMASTFVSALASGVAYGFTVNTTADPTANSSAAYYGLSFTSKTANANAYNLTGSLRGVGGYAFHNGNGAATNVIGIEAQVGSTSGAGSISSLYGVKVSAILGGTVTNAVFYGVDVTANIPTTTVYIGLNIGAHTAAGLYKYGLAIGDVSGGTGSNQAIVTSAGLVSFGDQVSITGRADRSQLLVTANGTQTTDLARFGGASNYMAIEADGTLKLVGNATGWKDIYFPQSPPKATGAGNPSLNTLIGNLRGYSYSVNDIHDFDPQEYGHDGKAGGTITWHIHWYSMTNVAATRGVKWELECTWANPSTQLNATTTSSIEVTVPANTVAPYHFLTDIVAQAPTGIGPGTLLHCRIKRIAAAGTAPADNPFVAGVHAHYEVDTPAGSRTITTK